MWFFSYMCIHRCVCTIRLSLSGIELSCWRCFVMNRVCKWLFTLSFSLLLLDRTSLDCAFENGSICEWTNDPNNWVATWKMLNSLLCLRQHRPALGKQTKLSARLYSPFLSGHSRIGCVTLNYTIFNSRPQHQPAYLSLLQKQMGWDYLITSFGCRVIPTRHFGIW